MQRAGRPVAIVCAVALLSWIAGTTRLDSQGHFLSTQRYEDTYFVPPPQWLKVFSLGYRDALASFLWMRMLVYFGDEAIHHGASRHLFDYADAILSLDPYFIRAYRWIAITAAYRPKNRGLHDVRRGIKYLERAAQLAPDDGQVAWDLGSFYLYELKPMLKDESEKAEAKRKAFEHIRTAVLRGAAPAWVALNTATYLENMGQREQQIAFLQEVYAQASSDEQRAEIAEELARLRSASFAEAFAREQAQAEAQHKRDFPYLGMDLFLQIGPKPAYDPLPLLRNRFDPSAARTELADDEHADDEAEVLIDETETDTDEGETLSP